MNSIIRRLILIQRSRDDYAGLVLLLFLPILLIVVITYALDPAWISARWPVIAVGFAIIWNVQLLALAMLSSRRQLGKLQSLNRIGQALSANLSLDHLLETIYQQAREQRDIPTFYVALLDQEHDQLTFPYVVENHQLTTWPNRPLGHGLVDHIMRTRQPLLLADRMQATKFDSIDLT